MKRTIIEQFDQLPPRVCRVLARTKDGKAMTNDQVAEAAGFPVHYVIALSKDRTWQGWSIEYIQNFSRACGVDLLRPRRTLDYIKRGKFTHVLKSREKAYFLKLMKGQP